MSGRPFENTSSAVWTSSRIMATGGQLTPGSHQHLAQFTPEELTAAVEEAHRHGLPITAQCPRHRRDQECRRGGVDGLEHASFWSEEVSTTPET